MTKQMDAIILDTNNERERIFYKEKWNNSLDQQKKDEKQIYSKILIINRIIGICNWNNGVVYQTK